MSNPKRFPKSFKPNHLASVNPEAEGNKGKKMQTKGNLEPDYVPPKGK
ncbi:small acid-soluble spore protein N [Pseudalkalibacillus hwajinpoensis]